MATMISEVYDAFIASGAPEAKAKAAVEAMAMESIATKGDIVALKAELSVIKWMLGIVAVATVVPFLKSLLAG